MIRTAVAVVALAVLSACASSGSGSGSSDGTSLKIAVVADKGASPKVMTLKCDPAGGDHPQAAQACAVLDKAGATVFKPVPKSRVCSMLYGGPQTATVKGNYLGKAVNATFKRTNGCEVERWEKLGTTFFNVPLQ
jgi:ABC-type Fe3+-hydroxamate transport system substrate-binding protein